MAPPSYSTHHAQWHLTCSKYPPLWHATSSYLGHNTRSTMRGQNARHTTRTFTFLKIHLWRFQAEDLRMMYHGDLPTTTLTLLHPLESEHLLSELFPHFDCSSSTENQPNPTCLSFNSLRLASTSLWTSKHWVLGTLLGARFITHTLPCPSQSYQ